MKFIKVLTIYLANFGLHLYFSLNVCFQNMSRSHSPIRARSPTRAISPSRARSRSPSPRRIDSVMSGRSPSPGRCLTNDTL